MAFPPQPLSATPAPAPLANAATATATGPGDAPQGSVNITLNPDEVAALKGAVAMLNGILQKVSPDASMDEDENEGPDTSLDGMGAELDSLRP